MASASSAAGDTSQNSVFTRMFLKALGTPGPT
jgi:hypothetical protein